MENPSINIHPFSTDSRSRKRWQMAYLAIRCSRVFSSLFNSSAAKRYGSTDSRSRKRWQMAYLAIRDGSTGSRNRKRWQMAYLVIRFSRVFSSLFNSSAAKIRTTLPYSLVNNDVQNSIIISSVSPPPPDVLTLTYLVKNRDLNQLSALGGVEGLASLLKSDVNNGTTGDIQYLQQIYGTNTYPKRPTKCFLHFLYDSLKDPAVVVLLVCASLSLGFGIKTNGLKLGWYDGGTVFIAVSLAICISAICNFHQNRQFEKPVQLSNNIQVEVVRSRRRQCVSIFEIIVGDVVRLRIGDQVPADGLFIRGFSLSVDESSMTGEAEFVGVDGTSNPFLLSGSKVADGYGEMLVTSVGINTAWGEMMGFTGHDYSVQTPLQERLNKLTSCILKVGLSLSSIVLLGSLVWYFKGHTKDKNGNTEFQGRKTKIDDLINSMVRIIGGAVSILGVTIPVGLPFAATLTLGYSMKRMMADHALVKRLSACETMGSATVICTDKTGTLTTNKMEVIKFWVGQEEPFEGATSSGVSVSTNVLQLIHQGAGLNTNGNAHRPASGSEFEFSGSPTEKAILSFAVRRLNMDLAELKQSCTVLQAEVFNSARKKSGILVKKNMDNTVHLHWKGAAETILEMSSTYYDSYGNIRALDETERNKFYRLIEGMAASNLRCIAFAHKQVLEEDSIQNQNIQDSELTLLCIVGLKDPCRPGVKDAVQVCQNSGVMVKMITGDNILTAKAIATECGILEMHENYTNGEVVQGVDFRNWTDVDRCKKVDKIRVLARSSPLDKLLIVNCLKLVGHVVAVTGDGANDAPALREADIGLSMGIQGTEVAKESADVILLDDNFASAVSVLKWGRCAYNKIQKFVQFMLTVNIVALTINVVAAVSAGKVPLTALQLLWVNLIMDTLGALALATEEPSEELMHKPPVGRSEPLITNVMWRNLVAQSLYQIFVLLTLQFGGEAIFIINEKVRDTLIFNLFVLFQVFNDFEWKPENKMLRVICRNKLWWGITAVRIALQVAMIEFLNKFAGTTRLSWRQWGTCIALAVMSWLIAFFVTFLPVPETPFSTLLTLKLKHIWNACSAKIKTYLGKVMG